MNENRHNRRRRANFKSDAPHAKGKAQAKNAQAKRKKRRKASNKQRKITRGG